MNKIQVGGAPSPNLKAVKSKIGSLNNATYKPGGGNVKIETKKLDFNKTAPKIEAKNDKYAPKGGDKKASFMTFLVFVYQSDGKKFFLSHTWCFWVINEPEAIFLIFDNSFCVVCFFKLAHLFTIQLKFCR